MRIFHLMEDLSSYYNSTTTLKSPFEVIYSNSNAKLFNKMVQNPQAAKQIKWKVEGEAQIESGFSSYPKLFSSEALTPSQ